MGLIRTSGPSAVSASTEGSSTTVGADQLAPRVEGRGEPITAAASAASADNPADTAADELWAQVQRALHRVRTGPDGAELRLRLHPAELGELLVQVRTQGDQLAVRLVASSTAAQQTLLADQQRLAAELAEAGFAEGSVDIGQSGTGTFGDNRPSGRDESTSSDPSDARSPSIPGASVGPDQALVDANRNGRRHTGLVDLTL